MLVVIDPHLGPAAHQLATDVADMFGRSVTTLVGPMEEPDDGLFAAMKAAPSIVVESGKPPFWIRDFHAPKIGFDGDAARFIEEFKLVTGLELKPGTGHKPKLQPLAQNVLHDGLNSLGERWRIEIVGARLLPHRLKAELVADFPCPNHLAAADFARAVCDIAEAQNHHPTLTQAYHTVTVRVTTGEAAGRLTDLDLRFAHAVNDLAGAAVGQ